MNRVLAPIKRDLSYTCINHLPPRLGTRRSHLCVWEKSHASWKCRRNVVLLKRIMAIGALLLALANPTLREEERENLGNVAIVTSAASTAFMATRSNVTGSNAPA